MIRNPKSNPLITPLFLALSFLNSALADTEINLSNVDRNSLSSNVGTPGSVTTSNSNGSQIVTYNVTNIDLAEDGTANDSLTVCCPIFGEIYVSDVIGYYL